MTKLTTHVLDTYTGRPAGGVKVEVYYISSKRNKLNSILLNNDGRVDESLVEGNILKKDSTNLYFL